MDKRQVGRYEIKEEIGRGGMASVWLAYDPLFDREVAIKLLPRDLTNEAAFRARFQREARTIAGLNHPAIVPVYDFGEEDGQLYLVMQYMTGGSLAEKIKSNPPLPLTKVSQIIQHIAPALDEAHVKGIIHRDIKPANILFDHRENVFLSDFGIAKTNEGTLTITGNAIIGTPAYMSPEQARGDSDLDGRSDIYALGVILYELLTGKLPYESDTPMGLAVKQITEPVPRIRTIRKDLPAAYERIILKAMAKRREDRYQTAVDLATAVSNAAQAQSLPTIDTVILEDKPQKEKAPAAKVSFWQIGGIISIILLAVYGGIFLFNSKNSRAVIPVPAVAVTNTETATATRIEETATDTAVPTLTYTPSATATPMPTDTAVPILTALPTSCPEPQAKILLSSINVRSGPGTNYESIGYMIQDDIAPIIASNNAGSWYNITFGETSGWISSQVAELLYTDECDPIAIAITIPATSTPTPTPTSTLTHTPPPSTSSSKPASPTPPVKASTPTPPV